MRNPAGLVALVAIGLMFGYFALSTDQVWMQIGAATGAVLTLAAGIRSQRND